ncbi:hypothetical protein KAFR_0B03620 [Kazachstania africana CBS 2517]|uniref:E3 ubiquitin-protein ligase listerin n=1 Tax=Kazachstania africana (strain ATCC 22294 / BCRC 22015 / CBS 2517 / CECT 1963 / NBRC 1671 / NRRL Y-8276) TaxID=1071382 RepID=H2AQK9_KAZAF|nr:hypothetical protein KAFR_0B03620 [Kazachstania africana CBS 2517]CCF56659.1 hypothetical protein KAFR_0B03620 [Kazachstania africana CBS 2517]
MSFGAVNTFQQYSNDYGLGHNGVKITLNFFDGIPEQGLLSSLGSNELILIFKSLLKRDDTTKEKALNDLALLLDSSNENLQSISDDIFLICWSQIFAKLVVNESKPIRTQAYVITIRLIGILNRKVSKFLKDFIPLILLGVYDTDVSVSKTCLKELRKCFNNNEDKINSLWDVFFEQILSLVKQVVVVESEDTLSDERYISKEESHFKYTRLMTQAVLLITRLFEMEKDISEFRSTFKEILLEESLWKNFNLKSPHILKLYESILHLVVILFKSGYLSSHKEILKLSVRRLLKSLAHVNSKNILKFSSITPITLNTLVLLDEYKNGRIWMYDKTSKEKLINFLFVGCSSPVPGVFNSMLALYQKTSSHSLLDYDTEWVPLWRRGAEGLYEKPFLGRFGAELLVEFWENYQIFLNDTNESTVKESVQSDVIKTLNTKIDLKKNVKLQALLKIVVNSTTLRREIENYLENVEKQGVSSTFLGNLVTLLACSSENEKDIQQLAKKTFTKFNENPRDTIAHNREVFKLCDFFVDSGLECLTEEIENFIYTLPFAVQVDIYDEVSQLLILYTKTAFIKRIGKSILLKTFFEESLSLNVAPVKILETLNSLASDIFEEFISSPSSTVVHDFITQYIENYKFDDNYALLRSNLLDKENIMLLYSNCVANSNIQDLAHGISHMISPVRDVLVKETDFISTAMFTISEEVTEELYGCLKPHFGENSQVLTKLTSTIMKYVRAHFSSDINNIFDILVLKYTTELLNSQSVKLQELFSSDLDGLLLSAMPFIDYRIAFVNALGLNTYLLPTSQKELELSKVEEVIREALFLDSLLTNLPNVLTDELIVFLTLISELVNDFNSISEKPNDNFAEIKHTLFSNQERYGIGLSSFISCLETFKSDSIFQFLLHSEGDVVCFYKARVVYKAMLNEVDGMSHSALVDNLPAIEKFVTSVIKGNGISSSGYLYCSVVLELLERISEDSALTKMRTLISSELIGIKTEELLGGKYRALILLISMLPSGVEDADFVPIAIQRLNLILNSIGSWLDSDIVYDSEFTVIRMALLKFFRLLVSFPYVRNSSKKAIELASTLLLDSVTMCQISDTPYILDLRSYCLELYQSLVEVDFATSNVYTAEFKDEISENVIELCFVDYHLDLNNQLSIKFYKDLASNLKNFKIDYLSKSFDRFFEAFLAKDGILCINRVRLLTDCLIPMIYHIQEEAVIDYELSQQRLQTPDNDDGFENEESSHKLSSRLIETLTKDMPTEYLEYENEDVFIKYLWNWVILLSNFKNISYKLRQLYLDQLKDEDLISRMFSFIADQVDLEDTKFWDQEGQHAIPNYTVEDNGFLPYREEIVNECKKLLAHIMYELFNCVGSFTTNWFLNIRDKSLQSKIEKFVSQYISSILITAELNEVSSKIDRLTGKDESLSIKINKVTNEIKAGYLIDEQKLEISFRLPTNYPLSNIQVSGISRVGISEQKWKQWIMSTQHVITAMNGSVLDSLELFTKNVNLQFSGFEECAICYSILHAIDRKLPSKTCPTCKNRFHGACLYKWFRSSGNNTCPLCRSEIPFRK